MAKGSYLQVIINSASTYTTEPIYQYDQGIYLQIIGLKNSKVTCHFAIAQSSVSVSQEPDSITNNECVIAIPDALTAKSENIICYVYVENELSEFTIYKITIPLIPRQKNRDININVGSTGVALDKTLSKSGYAADAKATGDAIKRSKVAIDTTLTKQNNAADAKATGEQIKKLQESINELKENNTSSVTDSVTAAENKATYTLRPAKIQYVDFMNDYWGSTLEEKARTIARYDVHVSGGILEETIPIINRARELNPNLKICYYISVASARGWFSDGWYTFRRGGIWDEKWAAEQSEIKNTIMTRPSNKWEILQEIEYAHHIGGMKTGEKIFIETYTWEDENGIQHSEDKYIDEWTGGISYDGFFWDDVGFDANIADGLFYESDHVTEPIESIKRQGFKSRRDKYMVINQFARDRGMFVIPNSIDKNDLYDPAVSDANPDGLGSSMTENDYVFVESCLTMVGDANSVIWRNEINRVIDYLENWYGTVKSKVICEDYMYSGMDATTRDHLLTYMLAMYATVGVHYFAITDIDVTNPTNNIFIPEIFQLPIPYDTADRLDHLQRPASNVYKYSFNSKTVSVTRDKELTSGAVDDYALVNGIKILVNGNRVLNAMIESPEAHAELNEKITELTEYVETSISDTKRSASVYNRLMIDDWSVSKLEYTPIITDSVFNTWAMESDDKNNSKNIETTYDTASRTLAWKKTESASAASSYQTAYMTCPIDAEHYGHTIEIGFKLTTQGEGIGAWFDTFVNGNLWFEAGANPVDGTSTLYPERSDMFVRTYSIADYGSKDHIDFQLLCSWNNNATSAKIENLYIIDLDEFEEDVTKDSYTNLMPTPSSAGGYSDPYLLSITTINDRSFKVDMLDSVDVNGEHKEFIEGNGPAWWLDCGELLQSGHTYEIGIEDYECIDGSLAFNLGIGTDVGTFCGDIPLNKKSMSKVYPKQTYHKFFTIPEDAVMGSSLLFLRFFKAIGATSAGEFTITNWYLHDIDEENVTIRGVSPSGVSIMFARVTDETFAKDQKESTLLSNTLYITDTGKMYITDVNKNVLQLGVVKEG